MLCDKGNSMRTCHKALERLKRSPLWSRVPILNLIRPNFSPPDPPFYDDYEVTHLKQGHFRAALKSRKDCCK